MNYLNDARFVDIGDLPTGFKPYDFKQLYMRQMVLEELHLIHTGMVARVRPYQHIIRAVQLCCSIDVNQLTDGDFEYVLAWLRKHSYPDFPAIATYKCQHLVYLRNDNSIEFDPVTAQRERLTLKPCGGENKELVRQVGTRVHMIDDDLILNDPVIDFPRVATLTDYYDAVDLKPSLKYTGMLARWIKAGETFADKLEILNSQKDLEVVARIEKAVETYYHGISEVMRLKCGECGHVMEHSAQPRLLSFFADNSETDIFNMIYNMLTHFNVQPDMKLPVKMFFFHHNTFIMDKKKAEQAALAAKGGRR